MFAPSDSLLCLSFPLLFSPSSCCLTEARLLPRAASWLSPLSFSSFTSLSDSSFPAWGTRGKIEEIEG